jgi:hypothetical protein
LISQPPPLLITLSPLLIRHFRCHCWWYCHIIDIDIIIDYAFAAIDYCFIDIATPLLRWLIIAITPYYYWCHYYIFSCH